MTEEIALLAEVVRAARAKNLERSNSMLGLCEVMDDREWCDGVRVFVLANDELYHRAYELFKQRFPEVGE